MDNYSFNSYPLHKYRSAKESCWLGSGFKFRPPVYFYQSGKIRHCSELVLGCCRIDWRVQGSDSQYGAFQSAQYWDNECTCAIITIILMI